MTTWRDHPQHHRGYLFLLKPETVFAAELDYVTTNSSGKFGSTAIWQYLFVDSITTGDSTLATVKPGMTLLLGSAPGLDDRGRTYVRAVPTVSSEKVIAVWASNNIHDGELAPDSDSTNYVTVLDDYRVWLKPPYYDSATGQGFFNGQEGPDTTTYYMRPQANGGMGWAGLADPETGIATITFDASGSYAASPLAALGGYVDITSNISTVAGLYNPGYPPDNLIDGNTGTRWESSSDSVGLLFNFVSTHWRIRKYSITAVSTATAPKTWTLHAGNNGPVIDRRDNQTGWSAGETREFTVDRCHPGWVGDRFELNITDNNGDVNVSISEIKFYAEAQHEGTKIELAPDHVSASSEYSEETSVEILVPGGAQEVYWQSAELPAWVEFRYDAPVRVTEIILTTQFADYAPASMSLQARIGGGWFDAWHYEKTDWPNNNTFSESATSGAASTRWRLYIHSAVTAETVRLRYMRLNGFYPNATYASWDVKDGTITDGTTTSERITATFPPGFRWVDLTVTDSRSAAHTKHIPVFVAGYEYETPERPDGTATADKTFLTDHLIASAFDKDDNTTANSQAAMPITVTFEAPSAFSISGYVVFGAQGYPSAWSFQYWSATHGAWLTADTKSAQGTNIKQTYSLPATISSNKFRWVFTARAPFSPFSLKTLDFVMAPVVSAATLPVTNFEVTQHTISTEGQEMSFLVHESVPLDEFPDGTLAMYWEDEWLGGVKGNLIDAGPEGRQHMRFVGWVDTEPGTITAGKHDVKGPAELRCVDAGGRLRRLAGFNTVFEREQESLPPAGINLMYHANIDRIAYVIARYMSTAPDVVDFYTSDMWDYWWVPRYLAEGQTLWEMIDGAARAAEMRLTCDKSGALRIVRDPMLLAEADKTFTVQAELDERDWSEIGRTRTRPPRSHWIWATAVGCPQSEYSADTNPDELETVVYHAVAPGFAPGQGPGNLDSGEQVAESSAAFLAREGNRYAARMNQPESLYRVVLAHGAANNIDPARLEWVTLTVADASTNVRGVTFDRARFLPYRMEVQYDHQAGTKRATLELEREVVGAPAQAYTPPE